MTRRTPTEGAKAASQEEALAQFLDTASMRILRYLAAFEFLHVEANRLLKRAPGTTLKAIDTLALERQTSDVRPTPTSPSKKPKGGVVDPDNPHFQKSIKLVQADIRSAIKFVFERTELTEYPHINELLSLGHQGLKVKYGSASQAWDSLVAVKHMLALPDPGEFGIVSWHISCTTEPERLIREVVALCFYHLGASDLRQLLANCFETLNISLPVETVVAYPQTSEAVAQILFSYMRQSSVNTLNVAYLLAIELGMPFLPDTRGLLPGLLDLLHWVPEANEVLMRTHFARLGRKEASHSEKVFVQLLEWRRFIIHISVHGDALAQLRPQLELFADRDASDFQNIAEFCAGLGLNFALDVVSTLLNRTKTLLNRTNKRKSTTEESISDRAWKLAAELRVAHLNMLKNKQWALAWVAGPAIDKVTESGRQDMAKLNSWFAQTKLANGRFASDARMDLDKWNPTSDLPRYQILKRAILGHYEGISDLLDVALVNDMTLKEIETWPALDDFRHHDFYKDWYHKVTA